MPAYLARRSFGRLEEMSRHIKRGAFAALRLGGGPEHDVDFEMFQTVGRMRDKMKPMAKLLGSARSAVVDRELTGQIRGEHGMDGPTVFVIRCPVAMVDVGMDMDQRDGEHPKGKPHRERASRDSS
jgi:hypothetical protein